MRRWNEPSFAIGRCLHVGWVLLCVMLLAPGCGPSQDATEDENDAEEDPSMADFVSDVGTVTYVDLEGGFYGIIADDSTRYNPTNLDEEFQEDGLRVRFEGYLREDVMTVQMWGENLELTAIMETSYDETQEQP